MSKVNKIVMSLAFADIILPVSQNEHGLDVVSLKPIVEVFGIEWKRQLKRINEPAMKKRLGTCITTMYTAGQQREVTCVRLNRVAAFLNTINPLKVKAAGNEKGADFLNKKQEEWDDVLHEYEMAGGVFNKNESLKMTATSRLRRDYLAVLNDIRKSNSDVDKAVLQDMARSLASELGFPYKDKTA